MVFRAGHHDKLPTMPTVLIDSLYVQGHNGIAKDANNVTYYLSKSFNFLQLPKESNLMTKFKANRTLVNIATLLFGCHLRVDNNNFDIFYQPHLSGLSPLNRRRWFIRLHDIFPVTNPEWFHSWANIIFKRNLQYAIKSGATFLVSSEFTKREIIKKFPETISRIQVIPCFITKPQGDLCKACSGCRFLSKDLQGCRILLSVGTIEPRKNYAFLYRFWNKSGKLLKNYDKLVIVGGPGWKSKSIITALSASSDPSLVWIDNCCDAALGEIYTRSSAFISASKNEGFNLPALEARIFYNLPLVLSEIATHREIHGENANYFDSMELLTEILSADLATPETPGSGREEEIAEQFKFAFTS